MVAYNFKSAFVGRIEDGSKTQTIRRLGKRRHARPGESLQLYTGMRTKNCRKILQEDPVCLAAPSITIDVRGAEFCAIVIDGNPFPRDQWEPFARDDGFESLRLMHRFWLWMHGRGLFRGCLIRWGNP